MRQPLSTVTAPSAATLRDQFLLDPDIIFLNHGSFGACPRPVFDVYQQWQLELERRPVDFLGRQSDRLLDHARQRLARYLNVTDDEMIFVPNATSGLNLIARSLRLAPDDEVLATDHEYGALDRTWQYVCERSGARYVKRPIALPVAEPDDVVEAIWSGVTPRTTVLFLSHITSSTALTLPIEKLCQRAREAGILSVIDGAHAPGQIHLDLTAVGADVYAGNCHKWLCAPKGSAFLHVRPEHHATIEPLIVSWGWVEGSDHFTVDRPFVSRNQWQGTRDIAAFLAVPAAIAYQEDNEWDAVRARCHALARQARDRVNALTGFAPTTADPVEASWPWFVQMATCRLPSCDRRALHRRLYDDYRIEIPITEWNGTQLIRFSFQGYNSERDLDTVIDALEQLLPDLVG